jgi:hypothetical protein
MMHNPTNKYHQLYFGDQIKQSYVWHMNHGTWTIHGSDKKSMMKQSTYTTGWSQLRNKVRVVTAEQKGPLGTSWCR